MSLEACWPRFLATFIRTRRGGEKSECERWVDDTQKAIFDLMVRIRQFELKNNRTSSVLVYFCVVNVGLGCSVSVEGSIPGLSMALLSYIGRNRGGEPMLNVGAWSAALDCVCTKPENSARASRPSGRQHQKNHALDYERTLYVALQRLISNLEACGASVFCINKPPAAALQTTTSEVYCTRTRSEQPCVVPFPFDRGGLEQAKATARELKQEHAASGSRDQSLDALASIFGGRWKGGDVLLYFGRTGCSPKARENSPFALQLPK